MLFISDSVGQDLSTPACFPQCDPNGSTSIQYGVLLTVCLMAILRTVTKIVS